MFESALREGWFERMHLEFAAKRFGQDGRHQGQGDVYRINATVIIHSNVAARIWFRANDGYLQIALAYLQ